MRTLIYAHLSGWPVMVLACLLSPFRPMWVMKCTGGGWCRGLRPVPSHRFLIGAPSTVVPDRPFYYSTRITNNSSSSLIGQRWCQLLADALLALLLEGTQLGHVLGKTQGLGTDLWHHYPGRRSAAAVALKLGNRPPRVRCNVQPGSIHLPPSCLSGNAINISSIPARPGDERVWHTCPAKPGAEQRGHIHCLSTPQGQAVLWRF